MLLAGYYRVDYEDIIEFQDFEAFKSGAKLMKVKNTQFTYRSFKSDKLEILSYAGGWWAWKDTD